MSSETDSCTFEALLAAAKLGAKRNFETFGHLAPVALAHIRLDAATGQPMPSDKTVVICPLNLSSEDEKDCSIEQLKEFLKKADARGVAVVSEVWITNLREGRASKYEAAFISLQTDLGKVEIWEAKISREEGRSPVVGEWRRLPAAEGGRFTSLIESKMKI
jgi:hypothetical protein